MKFNQKPPQLSFIRKLCVHLSEQEIEEAEARFMQYVTICREIAESEVKCKNQSGFDKNENQS